MTWLRQTTWRDIMNGLSLSPSIVVWALVAIILSIVLIAFARMWRHLVVKQQQLNAEIGALTQLRAAAAKIKQGASDASINVESLYKVIVEGVASQPVLKRRLEVLESHYLSGIDNAEAGMILDRSAFQDVEASRWEAETDEPRFWAGAFAFIGLIGTLAGLTLAVWHLMQVVASSKNLPPNTDRMEVLTQSMSTTFQGMGGAFLSTAIGICFTLWLSWLISRYERQAESFRLELEEFTHTSLEPLLLSVRSFRRRAVKEKWQLNPDEERSYLESLVKRMESVAETFTQSVGTFQNGLVATLKTTHNAFQSVAEATETGASKLVTAAASLENAASDVAGAASTIDLHLLELQGRINMIGVLLESQAGVQKNFVEGTEKTLEQLNQTVLNADQTFRNLDGFRADLEIHVSTFAQQNQETLQRIEMENRKSEAANRAIYQEMRLELQQQLKLLTEQNLAAFNYIAQENRNAEIANRKIYESIRTDLGRELNSMNVALSAGVEQQRTLVERLEANLAQLESYATHVSGTVRDHLTALQAGPLLEFDGQNAQLTGSLMEAINQLQGEIRLLRGSFGQTEQSVGGLVKRMEGLNQNLQGKQAAMHAEMVELNKSYQSSSRQLLDLTKDVQKLRGSFLFTFDRIVKRFEGNGK